jgi:hypothetical protein
MLATYVHPKLTPMPFEAAREALAAGLRSPTGAPASREVLALALAKCALETGRFQKIWNWNFGNIKASTSYPGMFTCIVLNEVLRRGDRDVVVWFAPEGELTAAPGRGGKIVEATRVAVPPGHAQTRMRAHANRFDGAMAYCDFMQARKALWDALHEGHPERFVAAMKRARYFTADETTYARAVASLFREFSLKLEGRSPEEVRLPEPEWIEARGFAALAMARAANDAADYARAGGL